MTFNKNYLRISSLIILTAIITSIGISPVLAEETNALNFINEVNVIEITDGVEESDSDDTEIEEEKITVATLRQKIASLERNTQLSSYTEESRKPYVRSLMTANELVRNDNGSTDQIYIDRAYSDLLEDHSLLVLSSDSPAESNPEVETDTSKPNLPVEEVVEEELSFIDKNMDTLKIVIPATIAILVVINIVLFIKTRKLKGGKDDK